MHITVSIVLAVVLALGVWGFFILKPNTSVVAFNNTNNTCLVIGDEVIIEDTPAIVENKNILLSLPVVKEYVDSKVFYDESNKMVIFTMYDKVIRMTVDSSTAMVNGRPVEMNNPVRMYDKSPYIPIEFLAKDYGLSLFYAEDTNTAVMDYNIDYIRKAEVIVDNGKVRKTPSRKAPLLVNKLQIGNQMRVFEEYEKWYKVRTENGIIGYIEKRFVKITYEGLADEREVIIVEKEKPKEKMNLVWEYVHRKNPDVKNLKKIDGLDIISPTWFSIIDSDGTIEIKADMEYVKWAHNNGYQVWALVNNSFDPELTHEILSDSLKREKIIQDLLYYYKKYNLDGINIDFENVFLKDKDLLTQFVRELTPLFREKGLIVSIDVTVKSNSENWSLCYDRKALGEVVDYVMVMTYDQHWASSPVAGSVAQYSWVERGLKGILEEVPAEKVFLGLPFYTRIWKIENIDGKEKVSSRAVSMERAAAIIKEKKADMVWDEESGQYYAEYTEYDVLYKIWIEDEKSINLKSSLVHKYDLAGTASWRKGFEIEEVWHVLNDNMKFRQNYYQWAEANEFNEIKQY
jgi:spore germination protein YaaH